MIIDKHEKPLLSKGKENRVKAEIEKEAHGEGYWLVLKHDNEIENGLYAITEEEIPAILEACEVWLEKESQRIMLDSTKIEG
jgi:hypothetical protein